MKHNIELTPVFNKDSISFPTVQFFKDWDRQIKQGERLRWRALEWLRVESFRRALYDIFEEEEELERRFSEDTTFQKDFRMIATCQHHWLIGQGERPEKISYPMVFDGPENAVRPLTNEIIEKKPSIADMYLRPNRLVLSLDPKEPEQLLIQKVKLLLKQRKGKTQRVRGRGAGGKYPLARMWEALLAHDYRRFGDKTLQDIGETAESYSSKPQTYKHAIDRGYKLQNLFHLMLGIARYHTHHWHSTFK